MSDAAPKVKKSLDVQSFAGRVSNRILLAELSE